MGTISTQFVTLLNDLEDGLGKVTVTSTGYIQISQQLEQQFVAVVNGIGQSSSLLSTSFKALAADVETMEKSVTAANQYSSK